MVPSLLCRVENLFAGCRKECPRFESMRKPVLQAAAAFKQWLVEVEPNHVQAVLDFAVRAWRRPLAESEQQELRVLYGTLREQDDRLLMTFTQRGVFYPIGLQAVLSYDDGQTLDFDSDRIIIEGKISGAGFGNPVQLADGTLVSCYTYRADDNETYLETVR